MNEHFDPTISTALHHNVADAHFAPSNFSDVRQRVRRRRHRRVAALAVPAVAGAVAVARYSPQPPAGLQAATASADPTVATTVPDPTIALSSPTVQTTSAPTDVTISAPTPSRLQMFPDTYGRYECTPNMVCSEVASADATKFFQQLAQFFVVSMQPEYDAEARDAAAGWGIPFKPRCSATPLPCTLPGYHLIVVAQVLPPSTVVPPSTTIKTGPVGGVPTSALTNP